MSRRHSWLEFVAGGDPLTHGLRHGLEPGLGAGLDAEAWQRGVAALQGRWYDVVAPPQVAAAFVLQWLLQVPAHTAAYAAACGPWRAAGLGELTFDLGPALVPERVRVTSLVADPGDLTARLDRAEADYRAVALPLADAYPSIVRFGPHTRAAMVDDMWSGARREAESASGRLRPGVPPRASCCLIYALPGCVECAGCPRSR